MITYCTATFIMQHLKLEPKTIDQIQNPRLGEDPWPAGGHINGLIVINDYNCI